MADARTPEESEPDDDGAWRKQERRRVTLSCRTPSKERVLVEVEGAVSRTWHADGERRRITAFEFDGVSRICITSEGVDSVEMFKQVGLASLAKSISTFYKEQANLNPSLWGRTRALPNPGPKGLPDGDYALWAKRIIDARRLHGRGYMTQLLAEYLGMTRSNILRKLERAEHLGLCVTHNEPGKIGTAKLTPKGASLIGRQQ